MRHVSLTHAEREHGCAVINKLKSLAKLKKPTSILCHKRAKFQPWRDSNDDKKASHKDYQMQLNL